MMAETKTKKPANKFVVGALAALIILVWGIAINHWVNPTPQYLGESDTLAVEFMLEHACPFLKDKVKSLDGKIEIENAVWLIEECSIRQRAASFEHMLIQEFSRHYD